MPALSELLRSSSVPALSKLLLLLLLLSQVSGLWWSPDDSTLVTAGLDGAVYEWRVLEGRRTRDFVQKGWNYSGVVSRPPRGGGGAVVVGRPVADAGSQT